MHAALSDLVNVGMGPSEQVARILSDLLEADLTDAWALSSLERRVRACPDPEVRALLTTARQRICNCGDVVIAYADAQTVVDTGCSLYERTR